MFKLPNRKGRALRTLSLPPLLMVLMVGCNVFESEDEIADEARVTITGTATDSTEVITSTKFTRQINQDGETLITFLQSDTVPLDLSVPFDEIYPVRPDRGFLVRVVNRDKDDPTVITIKVYFDGDLNYSQENVSLVDSSIEFSYIFTNQNQIF